MNKDTEEAPLMRYLEWVRCCYEELSSKSRPLFFRGHALEDWVLSPSIFRNAGVSERDIILDYKQVFALETDYINSLERILTEMQHHLIPTRLLDWSINALTALYFACSDEKYSERDGQVIAINPWAVYKTQVPENRPTFYFEIIKQSRLLLGLGWQFEEIKDYCVRKYAYDLRTRELEIPIPLVGRYMDSRVRQQQGCFTLWGMQKMPLDKFPIYDENMKIFKVYKEEKRLLLERLSQLGINEFSLFPDSDGFAKTIKHNKGLFKL